MDEIEKVYEIGILIYPDVQLAAVHGLTDLFSLGNFQKKLTSAGCQPADSNQALERESSSIRVTHWKLFKEEIKSQDAIFESECSKNVNKLDFLIIPPSLSPPISADKCRILSSWIQSHHTAGTKICSVCAGVFVLGESGLLNGKSATTHWSYSKELSERFPQVKVDIDKLLIDEGDVITSGGLMSWLDLGLSLVQKTLGAKVMFDTARFMVIDPPAREQKVYATFIPHMNHGDIEILAVQQWLRKDDYTNMNLDEMAKQAGLNPRTFIRRFVKATGLRPTDYCQRLRINRARDLLEITNSTIEEIAWEVGYENAGALRKIFSKHIGLTPAGYRVHHRDKLK